MQYGGSSNLIGLGLTSRTRMSEVKLLELLEAALQEAIEALFSRVELQARTWQQKDVIILRII